MRALRNGTVQPCVFSVVDQFDLLRSRLANFSTTETVRFDGFSLHSRKNINFPSPRLGNLRTHTHTHEHKHNAMSSVRRAMMLFRKKSRRRRRRKEHSTALSASGHKNTHRKHRTTSQQDPLEEWSILVEGSAPTDEWVGLGSDATTWTAASEHEFLSQALSRSEEAVLLDGCADTQKLWEEKVSPAYRKKLFPCACCTRKQRLLVCTQQTGMPDGDWLLEMIGMMISSVQRAVRAWLQPIQSSFIHSPQPLSKTCMFPRLNFKALNYSKSL